MGRSLRWPTKEPGSTRTYGLDISADIPNALIQSVSAVVMPSGSGEMAINALNVAGGLVEFSLTGGIAGRTYLVRVDVTPVGAASIEYVCWLYVDRALLVWPVANPSNPGFGAPVIWIYLPSLDYSKPQNSWMSMLT